MTRPPARTPSRTPGRRSAPRVPFALLVVGLLVGGLVLLLALNTVSAANELRRSALAVRDQEVSADVADLRNQVAASAAPAHLAQAAQQLGMVPAGNPAFIIELPNGRTVLRGHAAPVADIPLDIPTGTAHPAPTPTTRAAGSTSAATTSSSSATPSSSTSATPTSSTPTTPTSSTPSSSGSASPSTHHRRHERHQRPQRHQRTPSVAPTSTTTPPGGHP